MSEDVVTRPPANLITGVVKAMRPRQWVKNVIVLAAPLAALGGPVRYDYAKVLTNVSVAFVVFCLAASSIYLINDVRDVAADREQWVARAIDLTNSADTPARLEELRQTMRDRLRTSAACDTEGFARNMEQRFLEFVSR